MSVPAEPAAARIVGRLADEIEAEVDVLVDRIVERIRDEIPDFRRLPRNSLAANVRGNVVRVSRALRELRAPTEEELEHAADIGRQRAEQGLTVDAVLHAYRITVTAVWSRFGELARARGADVATVLAFSETLWLWADAVMDVVGVAHREVELQIVRQEQQRRDAFVLALLHGSMDAAELSRDAAGLGLDPDRTYVPFRARPPEGAEAASRRMSLVLAGEDGFVAALDHDLVGIATRPPAAVPGISVGVGPPAKAAGIPASFAVASRALQTAIAFGQTGVFSLSDLSIRPAILTDDVLGDAFVGRYLAPLDELGRMGAELAMTLRTWFDCGMRIEEAARVLHVHPNTLRHRMRRFEEATGANLRRPTDLTELWWALERARLQEQRGE